MSFIALGLLSLVLTAPGERLICCGGPEVFVIAADESAAPKKLWSWKAEDSPEIPEASRKLFRTTDDCKPYDGERLLITSSSGGVTLIRRSDKKCLFFTRATNAHSACLLPDDRVAVASSFGGDELLIFSLKESGEKAPPLGRLKLHGAHGAVWDEELKQLWAHGQDELLLLKLTDAAPEVVRRHPLPTEGGHDLIPTGKPTSLYVTTEHGVYRFRKAEGDFAPLQPLAKLPDVKSIDVSPKSGRLVYHQADVEKKTWWSDTIRFANPPGTLRLPGEKLYKVRWDLAGE